MKNKSSSKKGKFSIKKIESAAGQNIQRVRLKAFSIWVQRIQSKATLEAVFDRVKKHSRLDALGLTKLRIVTKEISKKWPTEWGSKFHITPAQRKTDSGKKVKIPLASKEPGPKPEKERDRLAKANTIEEVSLIYYETRSLESYSKLYSLCKNAIKVAEKTHSIEQLERAYVHTFDFLDLRLRCLYIWPDCVGSEKDADEYFNACMKFIKLLNDKEAGHLLQLAIRKQLEMKNHHL